MINVVSLPLANLFSDRMVALPLAIVYLTDRCNSKCVTCDYWRNGSINMSLPTARAIATTLDSLQTRHVLLSGGEPLLNPQWEALATVLRGKSRAMWLLTAGLSLKRYAARAAAICQTITVSLDAATSDVYQSIRGVDAFDDVCGGIRAAVAAGARVTVRCTVQRRNYRQLPAIAHLAKSLGASQVSFLAVDVLTHAAFARRDDVNRELALTVSDLPAFESVLHTLSAQHAADFASGFIAESPRKLGALREYFSALNGLGRFPSVRCNAPRFSAVFDASGRPQPCYFIAPSAAETSSDLNSAGLIALRGDIRAGKRDECATCVCSMHRGIRTFVSGAL